MEINSKIPSASFLKGRVLDLANMFNVSEEIDIDQKARIEACVRGGKHEVSKSVMSRMLQKAFGDNVPSMSLTLS